MNTFAKIATLCASCLIAACSGDDTTTTLEGGAPIDAPLPDVLRNADFLLTSNLRPTITLDNGDTVFMVQQSDGTWRGTINLPANAVYTATITWVERIGDQDLPLASKTLDIAVGNDGSTEETSSTEFTTQIDTDGDGLTNLDERRDGSEPFVAQGAGPGVEPPVDPVDPVEGDLVTLQIPLELPEFLADANFLDSDDLRPVVTVDSGATVVTTRISDEMWSGSVDLPADNVYKVTVTWVELFQGQDLPLTARTIDYAVGNDGLVREVAGTGFTIDLDFDDDGRGNFAEREDGTDPFESNSDFGGSGLFPATADAVIPRISAQDAPLIDGRNVTLGAQNQLTGEWAAAIQSDSSGNLLSIDHLMIDVNAEAVVGTTPYRRWAAMHDGQFLYVVVLVDDNGQRQRDSSDSVFNDDSLELFLDADNSKSRTYGANDFHRIFPMRLAGATASKAGVTAGDVPGPNSSSVPLDIDFATGPGIGPDGIRRANFEQDVYELRIPLAMAGISSDAPFGFELQVNDDDDGLGRDSKWGWRHPARDRVDVDRSFFDPSVMGTLVLE